MKKRILIIDDDTDILDIAQISFQKFAQWEVITATSGLKGIEKAKTEAVDVILLDVSMPNMDGLCVFEHLQANALTQAIPVVLLTAKMLSSDQRYFTQIGVAGVIPKPFNPVTIATQVAAILGWS